MTLAVQMKNNLGDADTGRGPSPAIWGDCPILSILEGSMPGMALIDDFDKGGLVTSPTTSAALVGLPYSGFGDTGSTITYSDELGGGVKLLTDGTQHDATSLFSLTHCFQVGLTKGPLWFEARIKPSNITSTGLGWFVGLADSTAKDGDVPLTDTAGALADLNLIGFHSLDTDTGDVKPCYKADGVTAVDTETVADAAAAATYIKLGFKKSDTGLITWFINNLAQAETYQVLEDSPSLDTAFPCDVALAPLLTLKVGALTGEQTLIMDWWRVVQQY